MNNDENEKPNALEPEHLTYLDELRESGVTNMFGASSYLEAEFPELGRNEARDILMYWMATFEDPHSPAIPDKYTP
ncbi:hypothetical protein GZ77_09500 [Endozoicomonas montiporae]|uniref:Uncharacterized protein n=2 Tax=Endozoicomonas montiporae TaxID=1027273 RepID=A0A081N7Y3_9GAMM|nr:hypothetical protein [Endozoicomonas montiporae]AMO55565.1 hypothetical protein EZMO1_1376 [Endozoicomonas montiporae CL-33]KEQ14556.1 hypothetical protein GZ77_09500 [Endozoicomonas montiporae]